ncbi:MAG: permease prefix domain 1-containing protein [Clostridium sp.]|uniref:permease prefix domain 1-containing protein n=1 Tax=Clostridium sp. TaxID=1506 RepID=UPI003F3BA23F
MDTIKNYLDNVFSGLPKTGEIEKLKSELLSNMEDKYDELKASGKSENEAIGIVISEFGNIDELLNELEIDAPILDKDTEDTNFKTLNIEDTTTYLSDKKHTSFLISIGVCLCMLGANILIFISALTDDGIILSGVSDNVASAVMISPLFILLVPAIALFIYSGNYMDKYKFIEKGEFTTSNSTKSYLENEYASIKSTISLKVIVGVCLCVISPLFIIVGDAISENASVYGVVILLLLVSVAVFLFINSGSLSEGYKKLLQLDEYSVESRKNNRVIGVVASIYWPLVTAIYLFISFVFGIWAISWIIYPIAGILFGAFCTIYNVSKKLSNKQS